MLDEPRAGYSLSNESEEHVGEEGDCGGDEGDTEIVVEDEIVVVVEIITEEEEIMVWIVEEEGHAEEVKEIKILREETIEEIVAEWRRRSGYCGGGGSIRGNDRGRGGVVKYIKTD